MSKPDLLDKEFDRNLVYMLMWHLSGGGLHAVMFLLKANPIIAVKQHFCSYFKLLLLQIKHW